MRILVPWLYHLFEAKGFPTPSKARVLSREVPKFKKKPLQKFLATMAGGFWSLGSIISSKRKAFLHHLKREF
ncbi:unnamed protein product [Musa acuminata subsp. burmannicoides]